MSQASNNTPPDPKDYQPGETTAWNAAWCSIYEHFGDAILVYAKRRGLDDHSAEDVLQEVMTTLIRCQHGQEAQRDQNAVSFQSWLWGVIRNRVSMMRRQSGRESVSLPSAPDDSEVEKSGSSPVLEMAQSPADFERREEEQWQRSMLVAAMRKVQERIAPENFAIYAALLKDEASPEELSRIHNRDLNSIYVLKHRCEKMLLEETNTIRQAWQRLQE